jgi:excisionase family DNA binding protein
MEGYLSIRQASKFSSLSPRFLYKILADKKLRYYRIGRRVAIRKDDLEAFIEENAVEPVEDWAERMRRKK